MSKFVVLRGSDTAVLATDLRFSATYHMRTVWDVRVPEQPGESFMRSGQKVLVMRLHGTLPKGEPEFVGERSVYFGEPKVENIEERVKRILALPEDEDDEEGISAVKKLRTGAMNRIEGYHKQLTAKVTAMQIAAQQANQPQPVQVQDASGMPAPPTTFTPVAGPVWTADEETKMQERAAWLQKVFSGASQDEDIDINAAEIDDDLREQARDLFAAEIDNINQGL